MTINMAWRYLWEYMGISQLTMAGVVSHMAEWKIPSDSMEGSS